MQTATKANADWMIWLRSLAFVLLYNLLGIVHSLVSLAVAPFQSREQRHCFVNHWTRITMWLLRHLNGIEIEILGRENLPQGEPVVVMANHQSEWETFYLHLLVSPQATVIKRELLWIPFFGWGLALLDPIAIDRNKPVQALKKLLREGQQRLEQGMSVVIYPEGTRQPPGQVGRFNPGGAQLACRTGRRVLPVAHNAGDCWPARSLLRRPGRIRVVIGPPLFCEAGVEALNAQVEQWIRQTAFALMARSVTDRHGNPG
ncbi:1-acyl-sn-glycerol-3-phosphate acyltransferase [Caldichromatium japonicum]|uniref:1-acyl-sn-glycerol-3-phosphate acyltransferase n=1 Tax=Caldichromatium japonicum TaxID=2699430 RepID=A0A6G7VB95_9GAMM|nr:lysophospholipid acyltransferase family protein [Caldichromatium japonicum]QIK37180.1 1-acyl-sn-glycerol-3-phosphate acyltransferase [Caldichromatium japonicum]